MEKIISLDMPFTFIVGARGVGKTYGGLEYMTERGLKYMYMRRTQGQADLINKPEFTPFKDLNIDKGWNVITKPISKYNAGFYMADENGEVSGAPLGYTCALSTLSNLRGFGASDIECLFYDEFIPEKHERPIKNEGEALFNAYETINRNRELKGRAPLKLICAANSNDLGNPVFMALGLVRKAENMRRRNQTLHIDKERGICLILVDKSPISQAKRNTALYRLTKGSEFAEMALDNNFAHEEVGRIKPLPLKELIPLVGIGELTIYHHKSNQLLYASTHRTGSPPIYSMGEQDRKRFIRKYGWIWDIYMTNNIVFEEYLAEILLTRAFK